MDTEQGLLQQDDKKWDRVWTTEEIRKNSGNWTLAGDAGLYNLLNEISQNIISRTHEVQNAVDTLVHNTKMASVKVSNLINDFHMLSNVQFVENRVYDEEVQEQIAETKPAEKTKEQREAEMLPKIIKAIELGMAVLDQAFNRINVNEISDSEDEDLSSEGRTILEPKDPYEHRPLPFIIGSEEFMADDYAGLKDLIREDAESSVEIESSSTESSDETSSDEEELPLDDVKFSEVPMPNKIVSDRYSSSDESELFGVEKEDDGFVSDSSVDAKAKEVKVPQKPETSKVEVRETRQSSVSSMQSRLNLPQVLPMPKQSQKKKESDDLFATQDDISDDESPFRKKTGLFTSEIRFEEEKDIFESDLFGSKPKESIKPKENVKPPPAQKLPPTSLKEKEPDLFGDDEDSEDDFFNKLTKSKKPSISKENIVPKEESPDKGDSSSTPSSAPSIKPSGNAFDFTSGGGGGGGHNDFLFGDESDGDDLFSSKKTTSKKFDFDASEEDDDLFGLASKKSKKVEVPKKKKSDEPDKTSSLFEGSTSGEKVPEKKKPDEPDKTASLFEGSTSTEKSYKKLGMPLPGLTTKKSKDFVFDDSDTSAQSDRKDAVLAVPVLNLTKDISLFDDDEDEDDIFSQKPKLFSPGKSPSLRNKPEDSIKVEPKEEVKTETLKAEKKSTKPSLFDFDQEDHSDDILPPIKKTPDTSLFEESDSFDLFKPKPTVKQKLPEVITPIAVAEKTSDKDSLFSVPDQTDGSSSSSLQKVPSPAKVEESGNIQIGFDIPANSSKTLNVLSKDRAKIATKRRKPTRKGRLAALESNDKEIGTLAPPTATNIAQDSADDFLSSSEEPGVALAAKVTPTHKTQEKKKMDLMSQLMSEASSSKILKKSAIKVEEKEEEVVDIFAELDGKRDSKSQSFSFLSPIESTTQPSFLEEEKTDEKGVDILSSEDGDNDEFFAEPSFKNFRNSISKPTESILDMDDDEDDLFSIKPNTVLKSKLDTPEDDIFADDSDIFSGIPKEKYEMFPSQLYDDEDGDDIFGSLDQSSYKAEKTSTQVSNSDPVKKEAEKKPVKEVEKKPAFEDPLTGLLGDD